MRRAALLMLMAPALLLIAAESPASAAPPSLSPFYAPLFEYGAKWTYTGVHRYTFLGDLEPKEKRIQLRVTCRSERLDLGRPDLIAVKLVCQSAPKFERLTSLPIDNVYIATARGLYRTLSSRKEGLARLLRTQPLFPRSPVKRESKTGGEGEQRQEESLAPKQVRAAGRVVNAWCHVQRTCDADDECAGQTVCFAEKTGIVSGSNHDDKHDREAIELTLEKATAPR